jgi:hypothetical protein
LPYPDEAENLLMVLRFEWDHLVCSITEQTYKSLPGIPIFKQVFFQENQMAGMEVNKFPRGVAAGFLAQQPVSHRCILFSVEFFIRIFSI